MDLWGNIPISMPHMKPLEITITIYILHNGLVFDIKN